jgi:hypothetical protein
MHRNRKMAVAATGLALLMAAGMSSAMAANNNGHGNDNYKVTICHATGSTEHPFSRINVSKNSDEVHGHAQHRDDMLLGRDDDNTKPCPPTPPPPSENHKLTICHLDTDGTFERIHVSDNTPEATLHEGHPGDKIIQDDDDFWPCPGDADDDDHGGDDEHPVNCSATSDSTTEQHGLVNVNVDADNAASNVLCQSQILSNVTASVLGTTVGGSGSPVVSTAGENCTAESTSDTDQVGSVNVNLNADNAAANLLCQSQILSNLNASVLGFSSPSGTEALAAGPGGLLSGLTADVNVLAKVLVLF